MFDAREAAQRLRSAGASDELAGVIVELMKEQADQAVTKEHLDDRFELLGKELELMEERLRNDLGGQVRTWVAAGTGIIALLMTLFEFIR